VMTATKGSASPISRADCMNWRDGRPRGGTSGGTGRSVRFHQRTETALVLAGIAGQEQAPAFRQALEVIRRTGPHRRGGVEASGHSWDDCAREMIVTVRPR